MDKYEETGVMDIGLYLLLATLLQFLGYVPGHHFLAQLHEQKSFNHL